MYLDESMAPVVVKPTCSENGITPWVIVETKPVEVTDNDKMITMFPPQVRNKVMFSLYSGCLIIVEQRGSVRTPVGWGFRVGHPRP